MFGFKFVLIGVWVFVGGWYEWLEQNGIVYFFEYMVFKGM